MKTYQNPQPHTVKRADKEHNKPNNLGGKKKNSPSSAKKTAKEIFQTESEEQAWEKVLKKGQED